MGPWHAHHRPWLVLRHTLVWASAVVVHLDHDVGVHCVVMPVMLAMVLAMVVVVVRMGPRHAHHRPWLVLRNTLVWASAVVVHVNQDARARCVVTGVMSVVVVTPVVGQRAVGKLEGCPFSVRTHS